jgi:hypothetical protein
VDAEVTTVRSHRRVSGEDDVEIAEAEVCANTASESDTGALWWKGRLKTARPNPARSTGRKAITNMARTTAKGRVDRLTQIEVEIREVVPEWPNAASLSLDQAKLLQPLFDERRRLQEE